LIYLQLFWEFFKTGLFAVGGAFATIPFLSDMGLRTGWFSQSFLTDMIAVSESTPGPIGVNMATYVGYSTAGLLGGIVATFGLITPSIVIILTICIFLKAFRRNPVVNAAISGMRPASTGLIAAAFVSVLLIAIFDVDAFRSTGALRDLVKLRELILLMIVWLLTNVVRPTKKLHPIVFILLGAGVGIAFRLAGA